MTSPSASVLPAPAAWFAGIDLLGPPDEVTRQIVERTRECVRQGSAWLEARHRAGAGGHEGVAARAVLMDGLLRTLFELAVKRARILPAGRVALVANGGYGRGELSPGSDIDLILLHEETSRDAVEPLAHGVYYPLVDAGLEVGWSVRTVSECLEVARADLRTCTALLDLRCLAGDEGLAAALARALEREVIGPDREGFIRRKLEEQAERREKSGSSVYMLEPHVKEGEGGLRDIQTAIWIARARFGGLDLRELQARGVVSEKERLAVERALEFLWRVRNALHYASGRKADQLTFELQAKVAREFGYEDRPGHQGGEQFLQAYYQVAAEVEYYSTLLIARASRPGAGSTEILPLAPGFTLSGGLIRADLEALWWDPLNLLRAFALCQEHDAELDSTTQEQILAALPAAAPELRASAEAARLFRSILGVRRGVARALRQMNRLQVLGAYLPEFGSLYCQVQYEMYHVYTVDQHSIQAVEEIERLRDGRAGEQDPQLPALMAEVPAPEVLYLGALLHDIGKGKGGDHEHRALDLLRQLRESGTVVPVILTMFGRTLRQIAQAK
ncbi:MAG: HD domain-containing protein, partial [Deltaproteobacteria bacterium]|nr:HD domain-containing protein [Deltaproteobacteria bacterium]